MPPAGVTNVGGTWVFDEYSGDRGVTGLGLEDKLPEAPTTDERRSILDLFRN